MNDQNNPWNEKLEIEGDLRESIMERHAEDSFEENLTTEEEIAEFEEWYDDVMDGDHESALESVYGPDE